MPASRPRLARRRRPGTTPTRCCAPRTLLRKDAKHAFAMVAVWRSRPSFRQATSLRSSAVPLPAAISSACFSSALSVPKSTPRASLVESFKVDTRCPSERSSTAGLARSPTRLRSPPRLIASTSTTTPSTIATPSSCFEQPRATSHANTSSALPGQGRSRVGSIAMARGRDVQNAPMQNAEPAFANSAFSFLVARACNSTFLPSKSNGLRRCGCHSRRQ
jgi:hypothetical protein